MKFILGRKLEMTQEFREDGTVVPVTLIQAPPCTVTQVRTAETDGYAAVQIGTDLTNKKLNKPDVGHLSELGAFSTLREFRIADSPLKRGDTVTVAQFEPGDVVDVVGTSKGRGFQGVVKRHHFKGGPASHGVKDQLRMPGSIASRRQGPVARGKRMAGRMGCDRVTVKNLEVVSIHPEKNILAVKGAIPGARGSLVLISTREGQTVWQK